MSAFYNIDFDQFSSDFVPWFLREYGFETYDGDFKLGNTNDQEVRFITQARNGHFYQYIRLGVGLDRFLGSDINKQKLNKEIRKNLEYDGFKVDNILIVTINDINELGITDQVLISILELDKYVISIEVSRSEERDGILLTKDSSGGLVKFIQAIMTGLNYLNGLFNSTRIIRKEANIPLDQKISIFKKFQGIIKGGIIFNSVFTPENQILSEHLNVLMKSNLNSFSINNKIS